LNKNEDLAQGIIESIDMDSYRPAKQETEKHTLEAEPGYVHLFLLALVVVNQNLNLTP
jgi:hypothetical protein